MYNIKSLLKEELVLNDRKNLLSEQSFVMINDPMYVKYVLGIDIPLNEHQSFAIRKKIIEEALSIQNILQSANDYLGNAIEKGKEYTVKIINTVKSTKDIVMLFRDLILSPENMIKANNALDRICTNLITKAETVINYISTKITKIAGFTDKMVVMLRHAEQIIKDEIKSQGWLGFLSKLGIAILLTFIELNFFDKILNLGVAFIKDGVSIFESTSNLLNMFKNFKETIIQTLDISDIINWITSIGKNAVTQNITLGFDILVAVTTVCTAVLAALNFKFDLQKRQ